MCVYVGSMDSQMAEWILTKFCRHDPWVPYYGFSPKRNCKNVTTGGGKRNLNFPLKKALKTMLSG